MRKKKKKGGIDRGPNIHVSRVSSGSLAIANANLGLCSGNEDCWSEGRCQKDYHWHVLRAKEASDNENLSSSI